MTMKIKELKFHKQYGHIDDDGKEKSHYEASIIFLGNIISFHISNMSKHQKEDSEWQCWNDGYIEPLFETATDKLEDAFKACQVEFESVVMDLFKPES